MTTESAMNIRELDERTVERIAAGEVVERPASAVKELVENSLDADAGRVEVAVEAGGTERIRVTDDGVGMTADEVRRAVEQHTTSKIRDIADLEGGVATLGFRGEALHAIGAVSRLTITTRPRPDRKDVDAARGTELTVEGGEVTSVEPAGCPAGTTIEIEDLFYNVPARRKYLKQESTEFAHVNTVVTSYALANPDVAVSLTHDGRETFATTGQDDLVETVLSVYGREVADAMIPIEASADELPDGPLDGVSGLVSHPETTRASRQYLSTYVNGRYVTASAVREAVVAAYDTQLAPDRYPFSVLFLDVPAGDVDVNVHPRKLEVRFADESGVREQIRAAVGDALLDAGLLRSGAPRGKSAPDEAEISPSSDDTDGPVEATDLSDTGESRSEGATTPESTAPGDRQSRRTPGGPRSSDADAETASERAGAADASDRSSASSSRTPDAGRDGTIDHDAASGAGADRRSAVDRTPEGGSTDGDGKAGSAKPSGRKFTGGHTQERLGGAEDGDATAADGSVDYDSLPRMRILGQYDETYVVAETASGLVLVDQHAADERVNYERLRERLTGETTTQALADPVTLSLTAREAELFAAHSEALARLGFRAERTGERTVEVRTVPSLVAEAADPDLLRDVLESFVAGERDPDETVEAAADALLGDLACYPSVTGNTSLTEGSVRELLAALDDCENPWACPHGRPVVVEFDADEIEARFERDYPGHGGRRE